MDSDERKFLVGSILTLVICTFGILGNLLCALVIFQRRMRSPYICLLQGLTFSDFFLLVLSTLRTVDNLGVGIIPRSAGVAVFIFFWDWIVTGGTKYYTVVVSFERLFVVYFPLKARHVFTLYRARLISVGIFIFCVFLASFSYTYQNYLDPESFPVYVAIVLHFVPFFLVLLFNILIFFGLRSHRKTRESLVGPQKIPQQQTQNDDAVTRMLLCVTIVFGVCYSFEFIRRLMNYMWPEYMSEHTWHHYDINILADIFYVLNSSVNFIIYIALGKQFRKTFLELMHQLLKKFRIFGKVNAGSSKGGGNTKGFGDSGIGASSSSHSSSSGKSIEDSMELDRS